MKLVINRCWGGFSLSDEAVLYMAALGSDRAKKESEDFYHKDGSLKKTRTCKNSNYGYVDGYDGGFDRNDPLLVKTVEDLGEKANGAHARLRVVEIPDDVKYDIHDYDGQESIHELHRSW